MAYRYGDESWARRHRGLLGCLSAAAAVVLLIGIGSFVVYRHYIQPYLQGSYCAATTAAGSISLELDQAANAATIAAVGMRKNLDERAVVIALATSLQESKLVNLPGGDRDSVGLFQQRPSQGWGTPDELIDPVYASDKFYDSLLKVQNWQTIPIPEAAQDVQHSADGSAYAEHQDEAQLLADAFTGHAQDAVHCWYPKQPAEQLTSGIQQLRRAFGDPTTNGNTVHALGPHEGWSIALWAVANAHVYGFAQVAHDGKIWKASSGHDGWGSDAAAPTSDVQIS